MIAEKKPHTKIEVMKMNADSSRPREREGLFTLPARRKKMRPARRVMH